MNVNDKTTKPRATFWQKHQFWLFLGAAIVLRQIPILSIPFNWLETYFHEISHGIAALLSGGNIQQIQLFANGAGVCTTLGGNAFLISFFGYAGAILWGTLIYIIAKAHQRAAQFLTLFILALLSITLLLWARDLLTLFIVAVLLLLFFVSLKLNKLSIIQKFLQLAGVTVLLNALYSPLYLFDGRAIGDGDNLASITLIPEFFWVIIWLVMALMSIFLLVKNYEK